MIIGGGPAGLTAAYELTEFGLRPVVLEKLDKVGGISRAEMAKDYYKTLGLRRDASQDEIQKAYRDLARKYHPDLNPEDKAAKKRFQEIQAAFEALLNAILAKGVAAGGAWVTQDIEPGIGRPWARVPDGLLFRLEDPHAEARLGEPPPWPELPP